MLEVNLKTSAATQITKHYNSMCKFNGKYLGATSTGLFEMGGTTDAGAQIPARVDSGLFDLGTYRKKRFRQFQFGIETSGQLKLSVFGDGEQWGEYEVSGYNGVQVIRVPIIRNARGAYWQWRLENVDGAPFSLYSVTCSPVILLRR